MFHSMEEILIAASKQPLCKIALICPYHKLNWESLAQVQDLRIEFVCIGEDHRLTHFPKLPGVSILSVHSEEEAIATAIRMLYDGQADILMNGLANPKRIFDEIIEQERLQNKNPTLSHIGCFEIPSYSKKMLLLTDAGVNIAPDLVAKVEITRNAIKTTHSLGYKQPKVAIIAPIEKVNPKNLPSTVDAAAIAQMGRMGQLGTAIVDGPLALDNAVSKRAAKIKKINSPVAGQADVLVVHDIETGNILYKILTFYGKAKVAATVSGASFPIAMPSRTDTIVNRIHSMALAKLLVKG